jgi:hypothetical protein
MRYRWVARFLLLLHRLRCNQQHRHYVTAKDAELSALRGENERLRRALCGSVSLAFNGHMNALKVEFTDVQILEWGGGVDDFADDMAGRVAEAIRRKFAALCTEPAQPAAGKE